MVPQSSWLWVLALRCRYQHPAGMADHRGSMSDQVHEHSPACSFCFKQLVAAMLLLAQSFEQLNPRAVAVVVDPIQSVKGKVVIDAFR